MLWTLMRKDLVQNAKALLLYTGAAFAFPLLMALRAGSQTRTGAYIGLIFGLLVFGGPIGLAVGFVGQEKVKGTLKFLLLLPLRGRQIITAKSLSSIGTLLILINGVAVVEPWLLSRLGLKIPHMGLVVLLWLNVTTVFFGALMILVFTLWQNAIAVQVAYLGTGALAVLGYLCDHYLETHGFDIEKLGEVLVRDYGLQYWGTLPFLVGAAFLVRMAGRVIERKEWPDLEED